MTPAVDMYMLRPAVNGKVAAKRADVGEWRAEGGVGEAELSVHRGWSMPRLCVLR
jgi:hypothetical protein